jgi:hypothetical protein
MKKPSWLISRRTMLRGAGTAMALPVLESMVAPKAYGSPTTPPQRLLGIHGQVYGYIGRQDATLGSVAPWSSGGATLDNNTYLRPFFNKNINSKITVLTGITERVLIGTHDSPVKLFANTYPVAKYAGMCVVLTAVPGAGTTVQALSTPDPFRGATADQIAAAHLGKTTKLKSLSLAVETIGGNPAFTMSNKDINTPIPSDDNPKSVFDRLFAGSDPQATLAEIQRRARYRKSVVDGVRGESASLRGKLGKSDQRKLDQYLESVFSLEQQIAAAGSVRPPGLVPPGTKASYANLELVHRAMQDLIVMAFVTDSTRVVAMSGQYAGPFLKYRGPTQTALDYSRFREFSGAAFSGDHHTMSHYDQGLDGGSATAAATAQKKDWMETYTHWSLSMYADLLAKLDGQMDIDGQSTILDNTIAIYGGDDSDSATHGYLSMPCILGGRGGKKGTSWNIRSGRELRFPQTGTSERSWKDLLWGSLNILGVPDSDGSPRLKSFGYAKNPLDVELA